MLCSLNGERFKYLNYVLKIEKHRVVSVSVVRAIIPHRDMNNVMVTCSSWYTGQPFSRKMSFYLEHCIIYPLLIVSTVNSIYHPCHVSCQIIVQNWVRLYNNNSTCSPNALNANAVLKRKSKRIVLRQHVKHMVSCIFV